MVTLIFLWGVSEYIWINILTYDPGGACVTVTPYSSCLYLNTLMLSFNLNALFNHKLHDFFALQLTPYKHVLHLLLLKKSSMSPFTCIEHWSIIQLYYFYSMNFKPKFCFVLLSRQTFFNSYCVLASQMKLISIVCSM